MEPIPEREFVEILHDMKIPLNVMLGYVNMLREDSLSPGQEKDLGGLENNIYFLSRLVDDLQVLVRNRPLKPASHRGDIREMVVEMVDDFHRSRQVEIDVSMADDLKCRMDPHFFRRIVFNLLENAWRHSPSNGEITLKVAEKEDHLSIVITNQVAPKKKKVDTDFYRPMKGMPRRDSTTPTGLGLAVSKNLAKILGGSLEVDIDDERAQARLQLPHDH